MFSQQISHQISSFFQATTPPTLYKHLILISVTQIILIYKGFNGNQFNKFIFNNPTPAMINTNQLPYQPFIYINTYNLIPHPYILHKNQEWFYNQCQPLHQYYNTFITNYLSSNEVQGQNQLFSLEKSNQVIPLLSHQGIQKKKKIIKKNANRPPSYFTERKYYLSQILSEDSNAKRNLRPRKIKKSLLKQSIMPQNEDQVNIESIKEQQSVIGHSNENGLQSQKMDSFYQQRSQIQQIIPVNSPAMLNKSIPQSSLQK